MMSQKRWPRVCPRMPAYGGIADLLAAVAADSVDVATEPLGGDQGHLAPPPCSRRPRAIICQKPFCTSLAKAQEAIGQPLQARFRVHTGCKALIEGAAGTATLDGQGQVWRHHFGALAGEVLLGPKTHQGFAGDCVFALDAMALDLVRQPWNFDVMVMENMFGDILSDLAGGLVGGMELAPCAEIGNEIGLFQPPTDRPRIVWDKTRQTPWLRS